MHVTAFSSKASYLQNQRRRGKRACRGPCVLEFKTMKKILFATVALLVVGAAAPAVGADLGNRNYYKTPAPAYAAPIYNWTGFYLGAHVGGAFSSDNNFNGLSTGNNGNGRFLGGVQVGADWQFTPNFVVGVEGQYSWLSGSVGAVFFSMSSANGRILSVRFCTTIPGTISHGWIVS